MQVRWSPTAAEDLSGIFRYIRQENPSAAERVVRTIYASAGALAAELEAMIGKQGQWQARKAKGDA